MSFSSFRPKSRKRAIEDQRGNEAFRRDVFHRAGGRSQLTGASEWPMDPHHCVKKQVLKRIAPDQVWEPDCGMLLTRTEHNRHHNRGTVIRYEQLPEYVTRWAEANGLTYELEKEHPHRDEVAKERETLSESDLP